MWRTVFRVTVGLALSISLYVLPTSAQLLLPKDGETLPTFEVATIKPASKDANGSMSQWTPDGFRVDNFTLSQIIRGAYGAQSHAQLVGGPQALLDQHFDVMAKMDPEDMAKYKALSRDDKRRQMDLMLQALLRDRFHLKMHVETRELPIFALAVDKGGPKLQPTAAASPAPTPEPGEAASLPAMPKSMPHRLPPGSMMERMSGTSAEMSVGGGTMEQLAQMLTGQEAVQERLVIDKTGLKGKYDWYLKWTPAEAEMAAASKGSDGSSPVSDAPGLLTAVREQLGLKLEPSKGPVLIVVIDHLEPPSPN